MYARASRCMPELVCMPQPVCTAREHHDAYSRNEYILNSTNTCSIVVLLIYYVKCYYNYSTFARVDDTIVYKI
jgi:hypothetical protein